MNGSLNYFLRVMAGKQTNPNNENTPNNKTNQTNKNPQTNRNKQKSPTNPPTSQQKTPNTHHLHYPVHLNWCSDVCLQKFCYCFRLSKTLEILTWPQKYSTNTTPQKSLSNEYLLSRDGKSEGEQFKKILREKKTHTSYLKNYKVHKRYILFSWGLGRQLGKLMW